MFPRMSELVDVPGDVGLGTLAEVSVDEVKPQGVLVDDVVVVRRGCVAHAPASRCKLQPS